MTDKQFWDLEINSEGNSIIKNLKELVKYKDLIFLFVKRDFISYYKQTILGPVWVILQPILTTLTFYLIFGKLAKIDINTDNKFLFFFSGVIIWNFFSDATIKIADSFYANINIFGKVYFPRLVVPVSILLSGLIKFSIHFFLFIIFLFIAHIRGDIKIQFSIFNIIPALIYASVFSFSLGLILASLTIKFKDLKFLMQFGIQLLMFFSPVIYSLETLPEKLSFAFLLNPMTSAINLFRIGYFETHLNIPITYVFIPISLVFFLMISIVIFNKIEKKFVDTL